MAQQTSSEAGKEVEVLFAVRVSQTATLPVHHGDRIPRVIGAHEPLSLVDDLLSGGHLNSRMPRAYQKGTGA